MADINVTFVGADGGAIDLDSAPINGGVRFDVEGVGRLTLMMSQLTPAMATACLLHGLKQKIGDAAAIPRDPETGRSATLSDKYAAMSAVRDRLLDGQWFLRAGTGSGSAGQGGLLYRALVRLYPAKTAEQLRAYLDGKTDAEQAKLRATPKVAAMIADIKAEDAARAAAKAKGGAGPALDLDAEMDALG